MERRNLTDGFGLTLHAMVVTDKGRMVLEAEQELDKLEKLAKVATPGPWERALPKSDFIGMPPDVLIAVTAPGVNVFCNPSGDMRPSVNADFIAAADPQTVIALIERVRKAEADLRRIANAVEGKEPK